MVTKLLFSISLNSFILFESVKLRKICGLRKCAGKFFAKYGLFLPCGISDGGPSSFCQRQHRFSLFCSSLVSVLRARWQVFFVSICFIAYYDMFFLFVFFSSSFSGCFCNSLRISVKMNGCFHRFRKAYPEKDIKSIGTSNIFPYLCPIIEL